MCLGISLVTLVNPVWLTEEVWGFPRSSGTWFERDSCHRGSWNGKVRGAMDQIMPFTWISHSAMVTEKLQEMK